MRAFLLSCLLIAAFLFYRRDQNSTRAQDSAATAAEAAPAAAARTPVASPACDAAQRQAGCLRILFVGNSYTYANALPAMFAQLSASANRLVFTGMVATGAWTLAQHAASEQTLSAIRSTQWDYVVLQEQSQLPSVPVQREAQMYPAAINLAAVAQLAGAKPILYLTWARKGGWPENGMPDFTSMQTEINRGYTQLAQRVGAGVAPVGPAWATVTRDHPEIELWDSDGSHPKPAGTYLAACVFYATIFGVSPRGLPYVPRFVTRDEATVLQSAAAAETVYPTRAWEKP